MVPNRRLSLKTNTVKCAKEANWEGMIPNKASPGSCSWVRFRPEQVIPFWPQRSRVVVQLRAAALFRFFQKLRRTDWSLEFMELGERPKTKVNKVPKKKQGERRNKIYYY